MPTPGGPSKLKGSSPIGPIMTAVGGFLLAVAAMEVFLMATVSADGRFRIAGMCFFFGLALVGVPRLIR